MRFLFYIPVDCFLEMILFPVFYYVVNVLELRKNQCFLLLEVWSERILSPCKLRWHVSSTRKHDAWESFNKTCIKNDARFRFWHIEQIFKFFFDTFFVALLTVFVPSDFCCTLEQCCCKTCFVLHPVGSKRFSADFTSTCSLDFVFIWRHLTLPQTVIVNCLLIINTQVSGWAPVSGPAVVVKLWRGSNPWPCRCRIIYDLHHRVVCCAASWSL